MTSSPSHVDSRVVNHHPLFLSRVSDITASSPSHVDSWVAARSPTISFSARQGNMTSSPSHVDSRVANHHPLFLSREVVNTELNINGFFSFTR
jgi:hypothetical protein